MISLYRQGYAYPAFGRPGRRPLFVFSQFARLLFQDDTFPMASMHAARRR